VFIGDNSRLTKRFVVLKRAFSKLPVFNITRSVTPCKLFTD